MKKKVITLATVVALAVGMISGCGSAGDVKENVSSSGESHLNFGCYVYSTSFDPAAYQKCFLAGNAMGDNRNLVSF